MEPFAFHRFTSPGFMESPRSHRQKRVGPPLGTGPESKAPTPGSLIISDSFTASEPGELSHGEIVGLAARGTGYKGDVHTIGETYTPSSGYAFDVSDEAGRRLIHPVRGSRKDIVKNIETHVAAGAVGFLEAETHAVDLASLSGAKNSVLNLSQGKSKASVVDNLYALARSAWDPDPSPEHKEMGFNALDNYAKAYDLNAERLKNPDPKVSGPERRLLQQTLVKHVDHIFENNSAISKSKKKWSQSVSNFEARNNSVVISASNEGLVGKRLDKEFPGQDPLLVPRNFTSNVLNTAGVTTVGSTTHSEGKARIADYSSRSPQGLYADGGVDTDGDSKVDKTGTSFSAPRVASAMATLHGLRPNLSSSQVEELLRQQMTKELYTGTGASIRVLK